MMPTHTTLQEKFVELENAKETLQRSRPKIQRVAEHLRNREKFKEHYLPKLVSIGPIHYDNANLKLGDKYKLMWAKNYIIDTGHPPQELYRKIVRNIDELKGLYAEDVLTLTKESLNGFGSLDEKLSWILFVDGCSLLHILADNVYLKDDQLGIVMMDVLLLENQIPYLVLKLLWKNDDENKLIDIMKKFLKCNQWATPAKATKLKDTMKCTLRSRLQYYQDTIKNKFITFGVAVQKEEEEEQQHSVVILIPNEPDECELPTHLLDLQRRIILDIKSSSKELHEIRVHQNKRENGDDRVSDCVNEDMICHYRNRNEGEGSLEENTEMITYRNIQDLRAVGIKLMSSASRRLTDIYFSEGWFAAKLTLPKIVVDDNSAASFLNLIAYEMCPDFKNDYGICSFAIFMDSLIDHPEDVRELRSEEILLNCLGSDEEVAHLFNIISTNLLPNTKIYHEVRAKIHKHYRNKYKTWIALGIHTYFNNPWTFIAFLAAFIALGLTFIQTWCAITEKK